MAAVTVESNPPLANMTTGKRAIYFSRVYDVFHSAENIHQMHNLDEDLIPQGIGDIRGIWERKILRIINITG
jgi:hypothetical protein